MWKLSIKEENMSGLKEAKYLLDDVRNYLDLVDTHEFATVKEVHKAIDTGQKLYKKTERKIKELKNIAKLLKSTVIPSLSTVNPNAQRDAERLLDDINSTINELETRRKQLLKSILRLMETSGGLLGRGRR